jgi:hypothetical protein
MADDVIGNQAQLLGVASDATARAQQFQQEKQKMNMQAVQQAGAPVEAAATQGLTNMVNKATSQITIDKQLAEGLGDPKLEGLQMDPKMFGALAKFNGAKEYHDQIIQQKQQEEEGKDTRQDKDIEAKGEREDKALASKAKLQKEKESTPAKPKGGKNGAPTELPNDKAFKSRFKQNETALSGVNGTMLQSSNPKEYADRQAYKQKYQKDYDEQTSPTKEQNAIQWLKKNHPELKNPTDADIQWAQENMGG